ncbi:MAG: phage DNA polymerase-like protein, DNA polymerase bacteriophage-type [candidate division WS6 bacterium GW2011_GWE2_33_157]|nr:MAG: phage DNA polymerase-like protein, DNA polymerase bacteriophage-type [candidate division WS6 bacterium GW2011_GWE2_33_157]KKP44850.1 MAG: phage DNA polymerase-like protein, DNA polymerase bacteriophage-type [candidate division WS6 bacterium GW2011_GWF1_33_233]KKP81967.1 MAG: Phage DNA polymerase-related protein [candidate division WS6 bacterium GW2011_GWD1_35_594]
MKISDFKTLKEIHEYFAVHNSCKLKKSATQPVYEIEPPKSGIVFIGEAPGLNEDKQGKPFVGSAGKLLDELLKSIGFSREQVYVTNVVKYRPPDNREPLPEEKDACRVWVNAELLLIKPKVIIPLGKHALERFIPDLKISLAHGQAYMHSSGIPIFAMYHPAVALYNPILKDTLAKDFLTLKDFLDGKITPEVIETTGNPIEDVNKLSAIEDILKL